MQMTKRQRLLVGVAAVVESSSPPKQSYPNPQPTPPVLLLVVSIPLDVSSFVWFDFVHVVLHPLCLLHDFLLVKRGGVHEDDIYCEKWEGGLYRQCNLDIHIPLITHPFVLTCLLLNKYSSNPPYLSIVLSALVVKWNFTISSNTSE